MTRLAILALLILPSCALDVSANEPGAECGREREPDIHLEPGCYLAGFEKGHCHVLATSSDPCSRDPRWYFGGATYQVWCDAGSAPQDRVVTMSQVVCEPHFP